MVPECLNPIPTGLFRDFRGSISWGRFCSAAALAVAIIAQWRGAEIAAVALWLGAALGNYGASKVTEMICDRSAK